jgi:MOSC domain-containing protein YiiM
MMASVSSVNIAARTMSVQYAEMPTGIGKRPVDGAVELREPGPKAGGLGSGVVGDHIGDRRHHGGTNQAVYAVARETLDLFEKDLGRPLDDGSFGENLTTCELDVDHAVLGERWRIGESAVVQVTCPRIPCGTFRGWVGERGWLKRFTEIGRAGAYLRIVSTGFVRSGDPIEIVHRPDHAVTVAVAFRAVLREPALLPDLLAAGDDLTDELRGIVASGTTFRLDP